MSVSGTVRGATGPPGQRPAHPIRSMRLATKAPPRAAPPDAWSMHYGRIAGALLLLGGLLPLLKRSVVFDTSLLVWPWQLAGFDQSPELLAAIATYAAGEHMAAWVAAPLVTGLIALAAPQLPSARSCGMTMALTGGAALALLLLFFFREDAVLGLAFTPPSFGAGLLMLVGLLGCTILSAENHAAKIALEPSVPRWLVGTCAAVVSVIAILFMAAAEGVWAAWPMVLLYLLVLAYGAMSLWRLVRRQPSESAAPRASALARFILLWSLAAVVTAQSSSSEGFVIFVVQAGGNAVHSAVGALKGFLIFFGSALLLATGLATLMAGVSDAERRSSR
jgi:hypothetical protein